MHSHHGGSGQRQDLAESYLRAFKKAFKTLPEMAGSVKVLRGSTPASADSAKIPKPRF